MEFWGLLRAHNGTGHTGRCRDSARGHGEGAPRANVGRTCGFLADWQLAAGHPAVLPS